MTQYPHYDQSLPPDKPKPGWQIAAGLPSLTEVVALAAVAAMSDAKSPQDLPMNEILAAIRRKITEAEETGAGTAGRDAAPVSGAGAGQAAEADEVLELTAALNEDGSVRELAPIGGAPHHQSKPEAPSPEPPREPSGPAVPPPAGVEAELTRLVAAARGPLPAPDAPAVGGRSVDDLVSGLVRSWLDDNLPSIVERLVKAEIERISRRS